jgi:energy-coupling factor transport system ATP-binding protein
MSLSRVTAKYRSSSFTLGPIDLSIRAGEIISIFGPNGGGKTTLLSLLNGLLKPESGNIVFDNRAVNGRGLQRFRKEISYVTQNPDLMLHNSTVEREVIERPRNLRIKGSFQDVFTKFDIDSLRGRHPFSLSQGQRQRLAVAAAVAGGTKLLLVDEPTTGQDWIQARTVLRQLVELAGEGMAVVFSTHNLPAAIEVAARALVVEEGKIIFDGSPKNMLRENVVMERIGIPAWFQEGKSDG